MHSNRPECYLFGNDLAKTLSSSKLEGKIMAYEHTSSARYSPYPQQLRKPYLQYKTDSFIGGQLCHFLPKWKLLTSECTILQTVQGDTINFLQTPPSNSFLPNNSIARTHRTLMENELASLILKKSYC